MTNLPPAIFDLPDASEAAFLMQSSRTRVGIPAADQSDDVHDPDALATLNQIFQQNRSQPFAKKSRVNVDAVLNRWEESASAIKRLRAGVSNNAPRLFGNDERQLPVEAYQDGISHGG